MRTQIQRSWDCLRQLSERWAGMASAWCLRLTALGALIGFAVSTFGQIAILLTGTSPLDPALEPSLLQRVLGVVLTTFGYAAGAFAVSLFGAPWIQNRVGRTLGVALFASVLAVSLAGSVVGIGVRIVTGSHVTLGAIEFCLASPEHFLRAASDGYAWQLCVLLAFALVVGLGFTIPVLRASSSLDPMRLRHLGGMVAALAFGAFVVVPSSASALDHRVFTSTPELAFATSIRDNADLSDVISGGGDIDVPTSAKGPPRSAGQLWSVAARESTGPRPNVLLLTLESVGLGHLGYEGYRRGVTPNLDALARGGLRVRHTWSTATHSNYAQMAILSSLFPRRGSRLDMYHRMDYPRFLFHDLFHELGYATATVSSQDESWQGMRRFQNTGTPTHFWNSTDYQGPHIDIGSERIVPDSVTVKHAKRWLERQGSGPWAIYVNLQGTHFPYRIPPDAKKVFKPARPKPGTFTYLRYPKSELEIVRNRYDNALAYVDAQIGRLRNYLAASGQLDNTLWVITSDHGEMFHEHGVVTHGRTLYEPEVRVPLILHWPKVIAPGDLFDPASHLDILPTLTDLLDVPPHPTFQGRSLLARSEDRAPRGVFMNIQGMRYVDGLVCYPWKLVFDRTAHQVHLFDLKRDPGETTDLMEERPKVAAVLAATLREQVRAQLDYHEGGGERRTHFQPRLASCAAMDRSLAAR